MNKKQQETEKERVEKRLLEVEGRKFVEEGRLQLEEKKLVQGRRLQLEEKKLVLDMEDREKIMEFEIKKSQFKAR